MEYLNILTSVQLSYLYGFCVCMLVYCTVCIGSSAERVMPVVGCPVDRIWCRASETTDCCEYFGLLWLLFNSRHFLFDNRDVVLLKLLKVSLKSSACSSSWGKVILWRSCKVYQLQNGMPRTQTLAAPVIPVRVISTNMFHISVAIRGRKPAAFCTPFLTTAAMVMIIRKVGCCTRESPCLTYFMC